MSEQQSTLPAAPRFVQFSTQGIAPATRLSLWESHNAKALISLDIRTLDESPLRASEINLHFPALRFAQVKGSAQIVERSEAFIRDHPMDVVAVFFALDGDAFFYHRGGHEFLKPGQAVMYDADLPFMRGFSRGLEEMVLTIPRSLYRELSGDKPLHQPAFFDFGSGAGAHAQALARLISRTLACQGQPASGNETANPDVERSTLELFESLISERGAGPAGYLATAQDYVERHLGDPGLSTPEVAAAVGISERQLTRVFAEAGLTLGHYVRGRRLDRAWQILTSHADGEAPFAELSARLGFTSQNYFSRAFKERFRKTPLQVRRETRAEMLPQPPTGPQQAQAESCTDPPSFSTQPPESP